MSERRRRVIPPSELLPLVREFMSCLEDMAQRENLDSVREAARRIKEGYCLMYRTLYNMSRDSTTSWNGYPDKARQTLEEVLS